MGSRAVIFALLLLFAVAIIVPHVRGDEDIEDEDGGDVDIADWEDGVVHELTADNFHEMTGEGDWFVKFFTPWCPHCRHLAPVFERGAAEITSAHFAEVNCDAHGSICRAHRIGGYPTILFLRNGQRIEYRGARSVDGFANFLNRVTGPAVLSVSERNARATLNLPQNKVAFVFVGDDAKKRAVFERVAQNMQTSLLTFAASDEEKVAKLFRVPEDIPLPVVFAAKVDDLVVYDGTFKTADLTSWVEANRFELVAELNGASYMDLREMERVNILLLSSGDHSEAGTESNTLIEGMRALARERRSHPTGGKEFAFLYMNARDYRGWTKAQFGLDEPDFPAVLGVDLSRHTWYAPLAPVATPADVARLVRDIESGAIAPQSFKSSSSFGETIRSILSFVSLHPFVTVLLVVAGAGMVVFVVTGFRRGGDEAEADAPQESAAAEAATSDAPTVEEEEKDEGEGEEEKKEGEGEEEKEEGEGEEEKEEVWRAAEEDDEGVARRSAARAAPDTAE